MTRFYAFLFVIAQIIVSCSQTKKVQDQPNIIFFLADDMRWDALGSAGNSIVKTLFWWRNVDRLIITARPKKRKLSLVKLLRENVLSTML